jgi:predicted oxidoreductase
MSQSSIFARQREVWVAVNTGGRGLTAAASGGDGAPGRAAAGGPALSAVVAGTWRMAGWGMSARERLAWIEQCVDMGITSFDHADVYGDYSVEELFGDALAHATLSLRRSIQIVTKCGIKLVSAARPAQQIKSYDSSAHHIRLSVEASLKKLRIECIELLLLHRPDLLADPGEIAGVIGALRNEGKLRHFGVSNHSTEQFETLNRMVPLCTNQVELSPLHLDALTDGTLNQCMNLGLRPMIWSPLAGGRLMTGTDEQSLRTRAGLQHAADTYGVALSTMAFAWIFRHPSRPVIITGTRRRQGLEEAVAALAVPLDRENWYRIWSAGAGHEVA